MLQAGCPYPIKVEGIIRCSSKKEMQETESKFKQDFVDFHKHREWYYLSQSVSEFTSNSTENGDKELEESRQAYQAYRRQKYNNTPEVAENARERSRNRWRNDPGYRERSNKRERERRRKNKSKATAE